MTQNSDSPPINAPRDSIAAAYNICYEYSDLLYIYIYRNSEMRLSEQHEGLAMGTTILVAFKRKTR